MNRVVNIKNYRLLISDLKRLKTLSYYVINYLLHNNFHSELMQQGIEVKSLSLENIIKESSNNLSELKVVDNKRVYIFFLILIMKQCIYRSWWNLRSRSFSKR